MLGLKFANIGQICGVDFDHLMPEGIGKDIWEWIIIKIKNQYLYYFFHLMYLIIFDALYFFNPHSF